MVVFGFFPQNRLLSPVPSPVHGSLFLSMDVVSEVLPADRHVCGDDAPHCRVRAGTRVRPSRDPQPRAHTPHSVGEVAPVAGPETLCVRDKNGQRDSLQGVRTIPLYTPRAHHNRPSTPLPERPQTTPQAPPPSVLFYVRNPRRRALDFVCTAHPSFSVVLPGSSLQKYF